MSLEPEKKRQRDELAAKKGATGELGTGDDTPAVSQPPLLPWSSY